MQEQQDHYILDIDLKQDFERSFQESAPASTSRQLILPAGVSIFVHLCLLVLLRQLMISADPPPTDVVAQPPSIQISFRSRPTPPPEPEPVAQVETLNQEPVTETILAEELSAQPESQEAVNTATETTPPEPPSQAPRLATPALLDVRDLIQNRAKNDETHRIYSNINCDERQRRNDLIDCGDEDPNAQYNFAAAEQNATVEFFADLFAPAENTSNQPIDRTSTDARTRAAQENMTGNLGANPLIRSVMGQP